MRIKELNNALDLAEGGAVDVKEQTDGERGSEDEVNVAFWVLRAQVPVCLTK